MIKRTLFLIFLCFVMLVVHGPVNSVVAEQAKPKASSPKTTTITNPTVTTPSNTFVPTFSNNSVFGFVANTALRTVFPGTNQTFFGSGSSPLTFGSSSGGIRFGSSSGITPYGTSSGSSPLGTSSGTSPLGTSSGPSISIGPGGISVNPLGTSSSSVLTGPGSNNTLLGGNPKALLSGSSGGLAGASPGTMSATTTTTPKTGNPIIDRILGTLFPTSTATPTTPDSTSSSSSSSSSSSGSSSSSSGRGGCICCNALKSACGNDCGCTSTVQTLQGTKGTIPWITDEFILHRFWLVKIVWEGHMLPAMTHMTEQLTAAATYQTLLVGSILDAKHQLETQLLFQKLRAQAHKEYHPSTGVCEFGTNTRSLAMADRNAEFTQLALAARNLQRSLLSGDIVTNGVTVDSVSRLKSFREVYCNPDDNGNGLKPLCGSGGKDPARWNKDIDYTRTIDRRHSLTVDFTEDKVEDDEEDLLALAANLYGHEPPMKLSELYLAFENGQYKTGGGEAYMDIRALAAKRSVAHNSFAAIAGMRAQGGKEVQPYMEAILKNMGIPDEEIELMLGDRPSYYAQMELLTKKLYQRPQFYSELYDKPVNVARQFTAMKALDNIQKRDIYRSQLRAEATLATLLEMYLLDDAAAVATELDALEQKGVLRKRPGGN